MAEKTLLHYRCLRGRSRESTAEVIAAGIYANVLFLNIKYRTRMCDTGSLHTAFSRICIPSCALPRTVPANRSRGHRDLSMLVLYLRRVALAFGGSLVVISLEDFLPRMGKVTSYLPVDKLSACLFVLGAAQRAQSVRNTAILGSRHG